MNRLDKRRQEKLARDNPQTAIAQLLRQGIALQQQRRFDDAAKCYRAVLEQSPANAQAVYLLGLLERQRGQIFKAIELLQRAVKLSPDNPDFNADLGAALTATKDMRPAIEALEKAEKLAPKSVRVLSFLANAYLEVEDLEKAVAAYKRALEVDPRNAGLHNNLGNVMNEMGRTADAVASFRRALAVEPNYPEAHSNLGLALAGIDDLEGAVQHFEEALRLNEYTPGARLNLGLILTRQGKLPEAMEVFRKALELNPRSAEGLRGYAGVLGKYGQPEDVVEQLELVLSRIPNDKITLSNLLFTRNYLGTGEPTAMRAEAERYGQILAAEASKPRPYANVPDPDRQLRIGLVSGDFIAHPVSRFLQTIIEQLDRNEVELFAYSVRLEEDEITARLKKSIPNWRECSKVDDEELDAMIRKDEIDILVDLSGHTGYHRLELFARKPAPVSFSWIGYFATTGISAIDYVLCNRWVVPPEEEYQWVEKPWRLPETYLCFSPPRFEVEIKRPALLENGYVTFGSYNNLSKLSNRAVEVWAGVLNALPTSRLLLRTLALSNPDTVRTVQRRFGAFGIDPERLLLDGNMIPYAEHLDSYNRLDIALDSFPYNGGTTTVEALFMGVPVLALKGDRYVAHMSESILHNMDMPEWIAQTPEDFVAKAVAFAADPQRLAELRQSMRQTLVTSPLMDAPRFARNLEAAFRGMWRIWCAEQGNKAA